MNGDFSKGSSRWKGDENIQFDTPAEKNKICRIELDDDKDIDFYQEIKVKGIKDIMVRYKIRKSSNYDGRGYQVRFVRDDGSYNYFDRAVPKKEGWNEAVVKFKGIGNTSKLKVKFRVLSGDAGYLAFDDIVVTEM